MKEKSYPGIDVFRIVAAVMIIAIHTYPLASYGENADYYFTHVLCRIAVPFFFTASGFFLFRMGTYDGKIRTQFLKKMAGLYLFAIILYLPVNIYTGFFKTKNLFPEMMKDLIFDGTFYHLWYLPAAILGACIAWQCIKRVGTVGAIYVAAILYLIGLFGDSYYGIAEKLPILNALYSNLFTIFDYTRNGILFAPIFFVLGSALRQKKPQIPRKYAIMAFGISLVFLLGEGLLLRRYDLQRHDSMYLMLIPCVYFLFCILKTIRGKRLKICAEISLLVYIFHPLAILIVRMLGRLTGAENLLIYNSLGHFVATTFVSFAAACFIVRVLVFLRPERKEAYRRISAEINTENLRHNICMLRTLMQDSCKIMAVVKADAYRHGAPAISSVLNEEGIFDFAVATIEEGIVLRESGISGNILIFGATDPKQVRKLRKYRLTQTVVSKEYAQRLNQKKIHVNVQIKIDTGMHRLGLEADHPEAVQKLFNLKYLNITGIYTHLCVSDSLLEENVEYTLEQIEKIERLIGILSAAGCKIPAIHVQNSGGLFNYPYIHYDYIRPGIALYGVKSSCKTDAMAPANLKPVLALKSRIILIRKIRQGESVGYGRSYIAARDTVIAVVSAGYADGVPRSLSGKGSVLIRGKRAPIIGKICMDQMTVDITGIPDVAVEDIVTLIGKDGNQQISAEEMAENSGSITNEFLCRIGSRVERIYK